MKNIHDIKDWKLDRGVSNAERSTVVDIGLKYPDEKQFMELKPKERIKLIDKEFKSNLDKLVALNLFDEYEVNGTKKRPNGVKAKIKFNKFALLDNIDFISGIHILSIEYASNI